MEYTYLNWPTIAFSLIFLILAFVEKGRFNLVVKLPEHKIICYSLYRWFAKEKDLSDLERAIFYPKYVDLKFKNETWCLYLKKNDLQKLHQLLENQKIKISDNKTNQVFNQFFEQK
ncbi:hypothetical protein XA3_10490 [Xylocopilactobacillus apicola]|uniref:Pore-forming protein n=2 Tax=Xylocopilactobacillus apicola TaxID=2932184 RepID=A0AAU9DX03_9LACO|nr:hypothetical protein XA3_10490 [Xylocopilactobacillus apicola]